jgi:hypothetical protein
LWLDFEAKGSFGRDRRVSLDADVLFP